MFDESSYKSTIIQFRNKAGNIVTLTSIPAMFQDAGMIVAESEKFYVIYGWDIDNSQWRNWDCWAESVLSSGAGIQLKGRRNHSSLDLVSAGDDESRRKDDYFFIGGIDKPKGDQSYIENINGKSYLIVDLDEIESVVTDIVNPHIFIANHKRYAQDVYSRVISPFSEEYELEMFFYIINGQRFRSYAAFEEALEKGFSRISCYNDIKLDLAIFPANHYCKHYTINIPDWAYKYLDCYEHGGCVFSESGTGMQCCWDTSSNVGVWYLSDWRIKNIQELCDKKAIQLREENPAISEEDVIKTVEEYRDGILEKQFEHDMHVISDNNTAYRIIGVVVNKSTMDMMTETEALGLFAYCDVQPNKAYDYMKNLVVYASDTILRHTVLKETQARLYWH